MNASSSRSTGSSEVLRDQRGNDYVTLTEKVDLTKKQYEVLNIVCTTYGKSLSEYMEEALAQLVTLQGNAYILLLIIY